MAARDDKKATKLARDLPKFREVVKAKSGGIPCLGGNVSQLEIRWDLNPDAIEAQVFELVGRVKVDGRTYPMRVMIARQALEHFLRAV